MNSSFSQDGGGKREYQDEGPKLRTPLRRMLRIDVIDTGIGISKENQKSLFKIFGKVKSSN